ncbi:PAAR domain-containing protein [Cupriavidus campinensis]
MSHPAARQGDAIGHGGSITSGSGNVFINGVPAAMAGGSSSACSVHGGGSVAKGSGSVFINGMPAGMVGGICGCGAPVANGSPNVFIGN